MKTLITSLAFGGLLAACGGVPEENAPETDAVLDQTEQGICEGYENGARHCTFKCTANDFRHWYGYNQVAWGQCTDIAIRDCGRQPYSVCWSIP